MYPTLFFPFIHTYGLMLAFGFYAAWWLAARRARAEGVNPDLIGNLVLIAIVAGVAGARLVYFFRYRDPREPFWSIFKVWEGGLVFYGGLISAGVVIALYLWRSKVGVWRMADILAPSLAIGQAFGRIGCFLNGCCYGGLASSKFPLAVRFPGSIGPNGEPLGSQVFRDHAELASRFAPIRELLGENPTASLPVHPTQLYDATILFLITALIVAATPLRRRYGELLALYAILNGLSRLATELVRRDAEAGLLGLTDGQVGAAIVLLAGLVLFTWARLWGKAANDEC